MRALLTSIIFDEKTKSYLSECMRENPADEMTPCMIEEFEDMEDPLRLNKKAAGGDYTLVIGVNLERHTTATLTLMHAENHSVLMQSHIDIAPVINSAIAHFEDYSAAAENFEPDEDNPIMDMIDDNRMACLKGVLHPYIDGEEFQSELLTALDLVTSFHVQKRMIEMAMDEMPEQERKDIVPLYMPGSKLLN